LWEADCFKIDHVNQKVHCRPVFKDDPEASQEFSLGYDYLIVAVGAQVNTFGTPGVLENCHFLKVTFMVSTCEDYNSPNFIIPFFKNTAGSRGCTEDS